MSILNSLIYSQNEIDEKRETIKRAVLQKSALLLSEDLNGITNKDLWLLFYLYDEVFLNYYFKEKFKGQFKFSFSKQLTSSAGITKCPKNLSKLKPEQYTFEIKISSNFLLDFYKADRDKKVSGYIVNNPLEAMMIVFEHELCHCIEYIESFKSSCKKQAFKQMANNIFGHTEVVHALPTKREINILEYGFKPGDKVYFEFENKLICGIVSRINKRATVMVADKKGRYRDGAGKRYTKFYVPIEQCH